MSLVPGDRSTMRTTALLLLALSLATPAFAQAPAEQGPPGVCARLWIERNGLFAERGYCHPSALGQAQFDLSSCRFQDAGNVPLTPEDLARIEEIRVEENRLGCRIDLTATSADQAARRLVARPGRDALVCHEGTTLANLREGPTSTAGVVARLPQGSPVHVLRRVFNPQASHHWLEVDHRGPDGEVRGFIYHELVAPRCEGFPDPAGPARTAAAGAPAAPPLQAPAPAAAVPAPGDSGELPLEVRVDLVIERLETAIASENHGETLRQIDELRRLVPSLDEIDLYYFEANAAFRAGELPRAQSALDRYLRANPRDSAMYGEALALRPQVEERAQRFASIEAELSRAAAERDRLDSEVAALAAEVGELRREREWRFDELRRTATDAQRLRNEADEVCRDRWLMEDYWYRHGLNSVEECVDFRLDLGGIYDLEYAESEARARVRAVDDRLQPLERRLQELQSEHRETSVRIESLRSELSGG